MNGFVSDILKELVYGYGQSFFILNQSNKRRINMKKIKFLLPALALLMFMSSTMLNSATPYYAPCETCGQDGEWQGYYENGYYYIFGGECLDENQNYCNSIQMCNLNGPFSDCYQIACLDCIFPS
ncbi:MAG: hypothetical protein U9N86_18060 [Bacteroidota bacterium]|nr:hypothetical protein [Bacteroidota bacterium]